MPGNHALSWPQSLCRTNQMSRPPSKGTRSNLPLRRWISRQIPIPCPHSPPPPPPHRVYIDRCIIYYCLSPQSSSFGQNQHDKEAYFPNSSRHTGLQITAKSQALTTSPPRPYFFSPPSPLPFTSHKLKLWLPPNVSLVAPEGVSTRFRPLLFTRMTLST